MPALVPHLRPAGSSPQFLVMFGAGLGSPSPVMKLPTPAALPPCAADDVFAATPMVHAASRSAAQAPNAGIRIRGFDMTPPRKSIRGHIVIGMRPDIKPRLSGARNLHDLKHARTSTRTPGPFCRPLAHPREDNGARRAGRRHRLGRHLPVAARTVLCRAPMG